MSGNVKKTTIPVSENLKILYTAMLNHFGPRGWWPGETKLEICIGAILTQSVSWKNVSKAIGNLKVKGLLDIDKLYHSPIEEIENCIVPTLYFRMKAKKIKAFIENVIIKYDGSLDKFFEKNLPELREELLTLYGIGPETADSIILYAAEKPIFVVDAYTRRIFSRLGIFSEKINYEDMQNYFMSNLPHEVPLFNEYHALLVGVGNNFCANKRPKCNDCPLNKYCKFQFQV